VLPPSTQIAAETNRIIAEQKANIIALSQGVPNLPIFDAAHQGIAGLLNSQRLPYTDVVGVQKVRETCAEFVNAFYPLPSVPSSRAESKGGGESKRDGKGSSTELVPFRFTDRHVIVTAGAIQAVYNVLALSIEGKSDVVVSPLPAYGLYKFQTELLGGTFSPIATSPQNNFVPTLQDLKQCFKK
jgi:aspartate/methionine/tyrosine aminotransferase